MPVTKLAWIRIAGAKSAPATPEHILRHLYASNEVLAQTLNTVHNLSFYLDTMRAVRHSISLGRGARFLSEVGLKPSHSSATPEVVRS